MLTVTQRATAADNSPVQVEPSDQVLLHRFCPGETDAATALFVRYAKRIRALARKQTEGDLQLRLEPDDLVQSIFRTFFRRASVGQYHIPAREELWKLLLVIALNTQGAVAARISTKPGDARSATPFVLKPGDYRLIVRAKSPTETPIPDLTYVLRGSVITIPIGITPVDPTLEPSLNLVRSPLTSDIILDLDLIIPFLPHKRN